MSNQNVKTKNADDIIFNPHEVAMVGFNAIQRAAKHKDVGIPLTVAGSRVGDYIAPLLPWEIIALQAQTHNGKTMFTSWLERRTAEYLDATGQGGDIVHVSTEESIEAMAFTEYGRLLDVLPATLARGEYADIAKLQIAMTKIGSSRIWRIGESAESARVELDENPNRRQSDLTLSNIYRALNAMRTGAISEATKIRLVTVDYLQALPIDPEVRQAVLDQQRRLQVRNDVYRLRKMTVALEAPIVVAVQCKQKLDGANPPYQIPGVYDGEETASIAQRFDRILSLWMPKTTYVVGQTVTHDGAALFTVTENMVFLKVNKQRGGLPSGKTFSLTVDYKTGEYYGEFGKTAAMR